MFKNITKFLFTCLLLVLTVATSYGRKFYWSAAGSDSYTVTQAQNPNTPWRSLAKITSLTTGSNGPSVFQPGDTLAFRRGDAFYGNPNDTYCAAYWWNKDGYWTAPSGTPTNPIVFTNYGDPNLPLPNWLHPRAYYPVSYWPNTRESRGIIKFAGVHDIIIDGIQSNDFRVPTNDKANPGYSGGWLIGEWSKGTSTQRNSYSDTNRRVNMVTRFIIRNCVFNNVIYGIQEYAGIDSKVTNCTFTNFKSSADTAGVNDVGAAAFEAVNGIRCEFSYNYVKGAWGKSGRISSTNGLLGIGFDMFNLYNSRIVYNTIIDCNGAFEIGNLDSYDSTAGFQYDTIAFNKIVNCAQLGYFHGTGTFAGNNHHIAMWNNVVISNNKDRNTGWGFGMDVYGDGQGFRPGTSQPWWFCRNPYSTWNQGPVITTTTTVAGSNVVTVSSATGISLGSVAFINNDSLLGKNYQTVFVTAINGNQLTLSVNATQSRTTTSIGYYLPINDPVWSNPQNSAFNNYGGMRSFVQYTDNSPYGQWIDTMFDSRNNIHYWTTGLQALYDRPRYKRSANIYYYRGGSRYASSLGGTLNYRGTKERAMTSGSLFVDTTNIFPENWDLHVVDTSYARTNGVPIQGLTKDFAGNSIVGTTPFIGLFKPIAPVPPPTCTFTYGPWATCTEGTQTRTYTANPTGCGVPPQDSLIRSCTEVCTSFTYTTWTACTNGFQYRDYTGVPGGCVGEPPIDSTVRACTPPTCPYTVSTTFVKSASCLNRSDGYATITVTCGGPSYTYRLTNLRTGAILNTITSSSPTQNFYFLGIGRYRVDVTSSGGKTSYTVFTISAVRRKNC